MPGSVAHCVRRLFYGHEHCFWRRSDRFDRDKGQQRQQRQRLFDGL